MKPGNDNSPQDDTAEMLDENLARLLKSAGGSTLPSRRFIESLIDKALSELGGAHANKIDETHWDAGSDWFRKTLGWAAMVAAACSAGAAVMASIFLKMNFLFQSVVVSMMIFNWLTYLGDLIR